MLGEPLEKLSASRSTPSSLMVRIAPLPNCFSIVETASAIALSRSDSTALPLPRVLVLVAMSGCLQSSWVQG